MSENLGWIQFRRDEARCPRCGEAHNGLLFRRVRKSSVLGVELTHSATCPTTGQPVVLLSRERPAWFGTLATTSSAASHTSFIQVH